MATFAAGDSVRISRASHLARYTGRIVAIQELSPFEGYTYVVHVDQTGLICSFPESLLELVEKSSVQSA